jgi:AcrR family transcriptional regulator
LGHFRDIGAAVAQGVCGMVEPVKARKSKPDSRSAAGKDRLLLVAMKLFAEQGFDSVTVRDISSAANVSVGLINHHFRSKDGLRKAVDDYFINRTGAAIERALEASGNLDPELIGEFQRKWIIRHQDEWPEFVSYFRRAIVEASPWGQSLLKRYHDSIRSMVDRLDADGKLKPDVDRFWLPIIYMFVLMGPIVMDPFIKSTYGHSTYEPHMWSRFQKAFTAVLWSGVGKPNTKK